MRSPHSLAPSASARADKHSHHCLPGYTNITGLGGSAGLCADTTMGGDLWMSSASPILHPSGSSEPGPLAHLQTPLGMPSGVLKPASPESHPSMGLLERLAQARVHFSELILKQAIPR